MRTPGTVLSALVTLSAFLAASNAHNEVLAVREIGARDVVSTPLEKGTIFVSPSGSGTGRSESDACNFESLDLFKGNLEIRPGDVVFFRGGAYRFSIAGVRRVYLKGGTASSPVIYESYPGETAIFDGSSLGRDDTSEEEWREGRLELRGEYAILRKVEVRYMPQFGVRIFGNHNTVEGCRLHHDNLGGLGIANLIDGYSTKDTGGSYNVVRDNVIFGNSDVGLAHGNYGDGDNADGITIHSGVKNRISHNTIYDNSDDGIDTWKSMNSTVEYNLVYGHGRGPRGNGNGIKLGGAGADSPLGANARAMHNISHSNKMSGINVNGGKNVSIEYNTVFGNGDYGYAVMKDSILVGNISIRNESGHVGWSNGKAQTNNSWQRSGTVEVISADPSSGDFLKPAIRGGFQDIGAYAERGAKARKMADK